MEINLYLIYIKHFIRVTDMTSEVHRVRLPRHFREDKQVRPYCKREAEGYKLIKVNKSNVFNYI